jgi:hypothetical protein
MNLKGCRRKVFLQFPGGHEENRDLSQDNPCPGQDSNLPPAECNARALLLTNLLGLTQLYGRKFMSLICGQRKLRVRDE